MKQIATLDEYFTVVRGSRPAVMVFSAGWCPDCRFMDTYIEDIVRDNPDFDFYKVDRDQFGELCETLDILGIPSLLAYRDGQVVGRFVSKLRKTREEVQSFLDEVHAKAAPAS
ncbi:thioredoxin family protein [Alicyclobacillus sp.]|uniref:thioredoxin family protein n=1 Tax=Alicyclobacillus sp. TaxID=61169 RepID=UPI0025BBA462|nr:thioredoxin family protein [Alicyclobacillus sp.]MCL6517148.1 thioredoxin family protein [Alicyclobacillus sp.]